MHTTTTSARVFGLAAILLLSAVSVACNPDRDGGGEPSGAPAGSGDDAASPAVSGDAGVTGDAGSTAGANVSGPLTTMGFGYESGDEIAKTRVDAVKDAYPEVDVSVGEGSFDEQAFLSAVAAGDAPDLVYMDRNLIGT